MIVEERIKLTAPEILHIVGTLGKDDFFGIEDAFSGMDKIDVRAMISDAENRLIDKGYANLDFNGSFSISGRITDMITVCSECDKFLDIQLMNIGKASIKKSVYSKDGKIVELHEIGDSMYAVTYKQLADLEKEIYDDIKWVDPKSKMPGRFYFRKKVLSDAKYKLGFGTEDELAKDCNNRSTAKVISNGLNGNSNYYSFMLYDFTKDEIEISSILILNSVDGSLEMEPETKENDDSILFKPIDYETVKDRVCKTLKKLTGEDTI